jgi:hypothetical protein
MPTPAAASDIPIKSQMERILFCEEISVERFQHSKNGTGQLTLPARSSFSSEIHVQQKSRLA